MPKNKIPRKLFEKYQKLLFLNEWNIELVNSPEEHHATQNGVDILACNSADPNYLHAVVTLFPVFYTKPRDAQINTIIHELCHCITQEAWNCMIDLKEGQNIHDLTMRNMIEKLTQRIANIANGKI